MPFFIQPTCFSPLGIRCTHLGIQHEIITLISYVSIVGVTGVCVVAIVGIVAWNRGTPELEERIYLQATHIWIEGYKRFRETIASLVAVAGGVLLC